MKLTFLGTGTSTGVPQIGCRCIVCTSTDKRDQRQRCSSLIEVEDDTAPDGVRRILIDCSPDFRQQMLSIDFKRLDAILITHEHFDHVGGLDDLRPYSIFGDVNLYAEPFCAQHLIERIPYCFTPKEKRYPGVPAINMNTINPDVPFQLGKVTVLPLRVMHGKLPILAFRIGQLGYVTDMKTAPEETINKLRGVSTLVVNGLRHYPHPTHQTIEEAIELSKKINYPETYLIHMSHHIGLHADEEAALPSHVHMAYDGLEIENL